LLTREVHGQYTFIFVYVDGLLITGDDAKGIAVPKHDLHTTFTIKDHGLTQYFLGLELAISSQGAILNQRKYILGIL